MSKRRNKLSPGRGNPATEWAGETAPPAAAVTNWQCTSHKPNVVITYVRELVQRFALVIARLSMQPARNRSPSKPAPPLLCRDPTHLRCRYPPPMWAAGCPWPAVWTPKDSCRRVQGSNARGEELIKKKISSKIMPFYRDASALSATPTLPVWQQVHFQHWAPTISPPKLPQSIGWLRLVTRWREREREPAMHKTFSTAAPQLLARDTSHRPRPNCARSYSARPSDAHVPERYRYILLHNLYWWLTNLSCTQPIDDGSLAVLPHPPSHSHHTAQPDKSKILQQRRLRPAGTRSGLEGFIASRTAPAPQREPVQRYSSRCTVSAPSNRAIPTHYP